MAKRGKSHKNSLVINMMIIIMVLMVMWEMIKLERSDVQSCLYSINSSQNLATNLKDNQSLWFLQRRWYQSIKSGILTVHFLFLTEDLFRQFWEPFSLKIANVVPKIVSFQDISLSHTQFSDEGVWSLKTLIG